MYSIPDGEVRKIVGVDAYCVTSFFSVFAYVWMVIVLSVSSPNVIELWEGIVTGVLFPVMVILAFSADKGMLPICNFLCWISGHKRRGKQGSIEGDGEEGDAANLKRVEREAQQDRERIRTILRETEVLADLESDPPVVAAAHVMDFFKQKQLKWEQLTDNEVFKEVVAFRERMDREDHIDLLPEDHEHSNLQTEDFGTSAKATKRSKAVLRQEAGKALYKNKVDEGQHRVAKEKQKLAMENSDRLIARESQINDRSELTGGGRAADFLAKQGKEAPTFVPKRLAVKDTRNMIVYEMGPVCEEMFVPEGKPFNVRIPVVRNRHFGSTKMKCPQQGFDKHLGCGLVTYIDEPQKWHSAVNAISVDFPEPQESDNFGIVEYACILLNGKQTEGEYVDVHFDQANLYLYHEEYGRPACGQGMIPTIMVSDPSSKQNTLPNHSVFAHLQTDHSFTHHAAEQPFHSVDSEVPLGSAGRASMRRSAQQGTGSGGVNHQRYSKNAAVLGKGEQSSPLTQRNSDGKGITVQKAPVPDQSGQMITVQMVSGGTEAPDDTDKSAPKQKGGKSLKSPAGKKKPRDRKKGASPRGAANEAMGGYMASGIDENTSIIPDPQVDNAGWAEEVEPSPKKAPRAEGEAMPSANKSFTRMQSNWEPADIALVDNVDRHSSWERQGSVSNWQTSGRDSVDSIHIEHGEEYADHAGQHEEYHDDHVEVHHDYAHHEEGWYDEHGVWHDNHHVDTADHDGYDDNASPARTTTAWPRETVHFAAAPSEHSGTVVSTVKEGERDRLVLGGDRCSTYNNTRIQEVANYLREGEHQKKQGDKAASKKEREEAEKAAFQKQLPVVHKQQQFGQELFQWQLNGDQVARDDQFASVSHAVGKQYQKSEKLKSLARSSSDSGKNVAALAAIKERPPRIPLSADRSESVTLSGDTHCIAIVNQYPVVRLHVISQEEYNLKTGTVYMATDKTHVLGDKVNQTVPTVLLRLNGSRGVVQCKYHTERATAIPRQDYVATEDDEEVLFEDEEVEKVIETVVKRRHPYDKITEYFFIVVDSLECLSRGDTPEEILEDPFFPSTFGDEECDIHTVYLHPDMNPENRKDVNVVESCFSSCLSIAFAKSSAELWQQQFAQAWYCGGSIEAQHAATGYDMAMHMVGLPLKLLFACVPPTVFLGGWATFFSALLLIGGLTTVVADTASVFGCVVGLEDAITAITFVALGTSVPDTFASMQAAKEQETADDSIGNVTGSI